MGLRAGGLDWHPIVEAANRACTESPAAPTTDGNNAAAAAAAAAAAPVPLQARLDAADAVLSYAATLPAPPSDEKYLCMTARAAALRGDAEAALELARQCSAAPKQGPVKLRTFTPALVAFAAAGAARLAVRADRLERCRS